MSESYTPEAPRDRPDDYTLLHSLSGHVRARPSEVFASLSDRLRPADGSGVRFLADARSYFVVVQGGWWYRAEYRVVPDDHGSHLDHSVLNVAQRAHRWGARTGRKAIAAAPAEFEKLLRGLRRELE